MVSDEHLFNVSFIVRDKVTRQCPQTTAFLKRGESRRGPSSYQPDALPLGQTGSLNRLLVSAHVKSSTGAGKQERHLTKAADGTRHGHSTESAALHFSSLQFRSVQDDIRALRKAHNYALHPVSYKFAQRCLCFKQNLFRTS